MNRRPFEMVRQLTFPRAKPRQEAIIIRIILGKAQQIGFLFNLVNVIATSLFSLIVFDMNQQLASTPVGGVNTHLSMDDLDYFFNRQSLHLSVCSLPQQSTQMRADIYNDIQISFSIIHPSVCLSDWLLSVPFPQGGGGEGRSLSLCIQIY